MRSYRRYPADELARVEAAVAEVDAAHAALMEALHMTEPNAAS